MNTNYTLEQEPQDNIPAPPTRVYGWKLTILRILWVSITAFILTLYTLILPLTWKVLSLDVRYSPASERAITVLVFAVPLIYLAVGAFIFSRKSNDWMALFASIALISSGLIFLHFNEHAFLNYLRLVYPLLYVLYPFVKNLGWICFPLFFLIFPTGHFVPQWTRWLAVVWIVYVLSWGLTPALSPYAPTNDTILPIALVLGCLVVAMVTQRYRYKRVSIPVERQQTKWVMFGCTAAGFGAIVALTLLVLTPLLEARILDVSTLDTINDISWSILITAFVVAILIVPISIGVAVLQYGLWEVNPLINRTTVYTLLTLLLLLVYGVIVVFLQQLFRAFTSQNSELAILVSTLTIAGLFNPLRSRIQWFVDKRFYRRKYDAAKVLAAFGITARDETDLERLTYELVRVVDETLQPEFVGLWLRNPHNQSQSGSIRPNSSRPD